MIIYLLATTLLAGSFWPGIPTQHYKRRTCTTEWKVDDCIGYEVPYCKAFCAHQKHEAQGAEKETKIEEEKKQEAHVKKYGPDEEEVETTIEVPDDMSDADAKALCKEAAEDAGLDEDDIEDCSATSTGDRNLEETKKIHVKLKGDPKKMKKAESQFSNSVSKVGKKKGLTVKADKPVRKKSPRKKKKGKGGKGKGRRKGKGGNKKKKVGGKGQNNDKGKGGKGEKGSEKAGGKGEKGSEKDGGKGEKGAKGKEGKAGEVHEEGMDKAKASDGDKGKGGKVGKVDEEAMDELADKLGEKAKASEGGKVKGKEAPMDDESDKVEKAQLDESDTVDPDEGDGAEFDESDAAAPDKSDAADPSETAVAPNSAKKTEKKEDEAKSEKEEAEKSKELLQGDMVEESGSPTEETIPDDSEVSAEAKRDDSEVSAEAINDDSIQPPSDAQPDSAKEDKKKEEEEKTMKEEFSNAEESGAPEKKDPSEKASSDNLNSPKEAEQAQPSSDAKRGLDEDMQNRMPNLRDF